jgi:hypothetical protein
MLPGGENGIRLMLQHDDGQMTIPLSVRITREDVPLTEPDRGHYFF